MTNEASLLADEVKAAANLVRSAADNWGSDDPETKRRWNALDASIDRLASSTFPVELSFQTRVAPWMLECFGAEVSRDRTERNHRFLEEALELGQAAGCTPSEAHQLVDYVYGRPVGELSQEVGGVMVTLAALCLAQDVDMHAAGETELARVWTKIEVIREKHAAKPKHSPLPGASAPATLPLDESAERAAFSAEASRRGWRPGDFMLGAYAGWLAARITTADNWRRYATERETTAQQVIERHRGESDALLTLLAEARRKVPAPTGTPGVTLTDERAELLWNETTGSSFLIEDVKAFARNVWGDAQAAHAHLLTVGAERENELAAMIGSISEALGLTETEQFEANGADKILDHIRQLTVSNWPASVRPIETGKTPAHRSSDVRAPAPLPLMRAAFRTTETTGIPECIYSMIFRFPTMQALHAAEAEWTALPIDQRAGSTSATATSNADAPTVAHCIAQLDTWNGHLEAAIDRQALEQLGQHANDEPFVVGTPVGDAPPSPVSVEPFRLLAPQPPPARDVVPGKVHCSKCGFTLQRVNLYMGSGTTGPGGEETEPCPNDGTPLLPVTWEQEAREAMTMAEQQFDRAHALEAAGAELVACKDLKDKIASTNYSEADAAAFDAARAGYARRKPLAWAAMRALLSKGNDRAGDITTARILAGAFAGLYTVVFVAMVLAAWKDRK